jgi:hypothetical protein
MTILTNPPQHHDRHAATRWYRSGQRNETALHTDALGHETFAEEQARWERDEPEYARDEPVRQAKSRTVSSPAMEPSRPTERSDAPRGDPRSRTSQGHTTFESHDSPAPGIMPEPVRICDEPDATRGARRDDTVLFVWPGETG